MSPVLQSGVTDITCTCSGHHLQLALVMVFFLYQQVHLLMCTHDLQPYAAAFHCMHATCTGGVFPLPLRHLLVCIPTNEHALQLVLRGGGCYVFLWDILRHCHCSPIRLRNVKCVWSSNPTSLQSVAGPRPPLNPEICLPPSPEVHLPPSQTPRLPSGLGVGRLGIPVLALVVRTLTRHSCPGHRRPVTAVYWKSAWNSTLEWTKKALLPTTALLYRTQSTVTYPWSCV